MGKIIGLIACSSTKLGKDSPAEKYLAKDIYKGHTFILSKEEGLKNTSVKYGTLSTLRQSIASIVVHNQYDKKATDNFIDKLEVEYFFNDNPIKSTDAKNELTDIEKQLLQEHLRVLNIRDNNHPCAKEIKKELKRLRKISKNTAIA